MLRWRLAMQYLFRLKLAIRSQTRGFFALFSGSSASGLSRSRWLAMTRSVMSKPRLPQAGEPFISTAIRAKKLPSVPWPSCIRPTRLVNSPDSCHDSVPMKRRNRWLVPYIAAVVALFIRLWMGTMRVRMVAADGQRHPTDPASNRYLYAFWHEGLLAPLA